jgi:hypothetical protein
MSVYDMANSKVAQFDAEHGEFIVLEHEILFRDGAKREVSNMGRLQEPPSDPIELLHNKRMYWKAVCDLASEKFEYFKNNHMLSAKMALQSSMVPGPNGKVTDIMAKGRQLKRELDAATKEYTKYTEEYEGLHSETPRQKELRERRETARSEHEMLVDFFKNL